MLHRIIPVFVVAAVGCGGATELNGEASSSDASGGTGGDGSGGTGPTTAGPTTAGSTTAGSTSGGGNTSVSTASASVTVTTVTTATTAATSSTTGMNCAGVECGGLPCHDGRFEVPPGECCPICVCSEIACPAVDCPNGHMETVPEYCCPQCVEALCEGVMCSPPYDCGSGRTFTRPDGACCSGCMPDEPGSVGCVDIACPVEDNCAQGYLRGDLMGACCYECLPDPLYCEQDADCVIADRPRSCCGCPEVISTRALADDACWTPVADPRPIPDECYPEVTCDRECDACPEPGGAWCVDNRCLEVVIE